MTSGASTLLSAQLGYRPKRIQFGIVSLSSALLLAEGQSVSFGRADIAEGGLQALP